MQGARYVVLLPAALMIVTGCASKNWVRTEMSKREAEINQRITKVDDRVGEESQRVDKRVEGVEGRVTAESQRVEGMGTRVGTLETTMTSTSEAVRNNRERADAAMAKAEGVDSRLTRLWTNRFSPKVVETMNVQFGFNRFDLDDGAQTALVGLAREMQANPGLLVELTGFTDSKGARDYNYQLSQRRVDAVRRFLVERGVQVARIQAIGLGSSADRGTPEAEKRRVTAKLMIDQD